MKTTLKEALKKDGRTNWSKLKYMTDEEIDQAIQNDQDIRVLRCNQSAQK